MGTKIAPQVTALIRRYVIILCQNKITSATRIFLWPMFLIGGLIYTRLAVDSSIGLAFSSFIPYLLVFITAFQINHFVEFIVNDKESGLRSLMFTMGLRRISYLWWFVISSLVLMLPFILTIGLFSINYLLEKEQDSPLILFVFLQYGLQLSGMILLISSFISVTKYSPISVAIVVLELNCIHPLVLKGIAGLNETNQKLLLFLATASPVESMRLVVDSHTTNPNQKSTISFPTIYILIGMIFWTILYYLFAIWFDQVCPWKKDEASKSPLFCLKKATRKSHENGSEMDDSAASRSKYFEATSPSRHVGIKIIGVKKTFDGKVAVDNVSFNILKGETTLLLGHNGAGKTTLMNLILKKLNPDAGQVMVSTSRTQALGVCPQTSILDDDLTVRQHLELFHDIKTCSSSSDRQHNVNKVLDDVCLKAHSNKIPEELSGGMKRKLSLGIAFVGDSSVLILDEPSSGLDPDSRLSMWNTIRLYRSDRTVLLSTQHMEEADYLGDRIAIMSGGKIVCCGSNVFLNSLFGSGYKLRVECLISAQAKVMSLIKNYFKEAQLTKDNQLAACTSQDGESTRDIVIELAAGGHSDDYESHLIKLLEHLENHPDPAIKSYGLNSSSMDEVMNNVKKIFYTETQQTSMNSNVLLSEAYLDKIANPDKSSSNNRARVYCSLLKKHLNFYRRDWKSFIIFRLVLPYLAANSTSSEIAELVFTHRSNVVMNLYRILAVIHVIYYPTLERATKFKVIQLASGANFMVYWLAFMTCDLVPIIVYTCSYLYHLLTEHGRYISESLSVTLIIGLLMILFGLASIILGYLTSNMIQNPKTSVGLYFLLFSLGPAINLIGFVILAITEYDSAWAIDILLSILLPTYPVQQATLGLNERCYVRDPLEECVKTKSFKIEFAFICLIGQIVVYATLTALVEYNLVDLRYYCNLSNLWRFLLGKKPSIELDHRTLLQSDSDVTDEAVKAERLIQTSSNSHGLVAHGLVKSYIYGSPVVKNISFTVEKGECFGLLGVNGAGKSTTFSMVAGECRPDAGRLFLWGHDNNLDITTYRRSLGYDPQASPDIPLSPVEALTLMARLRGVREESIADLVFAVVETLDMSEHSNKSAQDLSGGTLRKLALGMSLIGNPHFLALDEPTAGVDPMARRDVWRLLKALQMKHHCSILISSHAMEECEAICNRIAIMARGRLRCIGSFLHLRTKFSQSCKIKVQFVQLERSTGSSSSSHQRSAIAELQKRLNSQFGSSVKLVDTNINGVSFDIIDRSVKRSAILKVLADFRDKRSRITFMLNDSSLEDIFMTLAQEQQ